MSKESKIDLSKIFGSQVSELSEEQVTQICGRIEDIVESRVKAKIDLQTEIAEAEAKEKYDSLLKESTTEYTSTISDMEEALLEKATSYQETIIEKAEQFVAEFVESKEQELQQFQESIVDKLDKYLELELEKNIPQEFHEAAAKVAIMEPIVQDVMESFKKNYIKCDTESFGLLKEAHSEISGLRAQLSEQTKNLMDLNSKHKVVERSMKISKVCEGLSTAQMEKAQKLLEGVDVNQIERKFEMIRDIVLEDTHSYKGKEVVTESATSSFEKRSGDVSVSKVVSEETHQMESEEGTRKVVTESAINPEAQRVMGYAAEFQKRWGKK